jgi:hypothetical protein
MYSSQSSESVVVIALASSACHCFRNVSHRPRTELPFPLWLRSATKSLIISMAGTSLADAR